jgi:hypothetical protein
VTAAGLLLGALFAADPAEGLASPFRDAREAAIRELARLGAGAIRPLLDHADLRVGLGAIEALGRCGVEAAEPLAAAAGHRDPERGAAAARALVALACERLLDLEALSAPPLAVERLETAVRSEVAERIALLRAPPAFDQPQVYRPMFVLGRAAERALLASAADRALEGDARAHAVVALARLAGAEAAPALRAALEDSEPAVRGAAATMLVRLGDVEGCRALAAALGRGFRLDALVRQAAVAAVAAGAEADGEGLATLEAIVERMSLPEACAAAAALRRADPNRAARAVAVRMRRFLASEQAVPGAGAGAAALALAADATESSWADSLRGHPDALLRAAVARGPGALQAARALFAPSRDDAGREGVRVQVVATLLLRHDAPWDDRLACAQPLLSSDASHYRRWGAALLEGAPAEVVAPVAPALVAILEDRVETTRLLAAAAVAPHAPAGAARVALLALVDGDPQAARTAARVLAAAGHDLATLDSRAPVRERRRRALAALGALLGKP